MACESSSSASIFVVHGAEFLGEEQSDSFNDTDFPVVTEVGFPVDDELPDVKEAESSFFNDVDFFDDTGANDVDDIPFVEAVDFFCVEDIRSPVDDVSSPSVEDVGSPDTDTGFLDDTNAALLEDDCPFAEDPDFICVEDVGSPDTNVDFLDDTDFFLLDDDFPFIEDTDFL